MLKKLEFDELERAETIMAQEASEPGKGMVERREQIRDLLMLSQARSLKRIADGMSERNEYGEGPAAAIGGNLARCLSSIR